MTDELPVDQLVMLVRAASAETQARLPMWTIYDRPEDFPEHFVARLWCSLPQPAPSGFTLRFAPDRVDLVRDILSKAGFVKTDRDPSDDLTVIETWV